MKDCLFCKIVDKQIPSKIVFENDKVLALANKDSEWLSRIYWQSVSLAIKHGSKKVSFSFDGEAVRCKVDK